MSTAASDLPDAPDTSGESRHPPLRFVTAASLFDGHDAAINIMRRILQSSGAEVIHLGHDRSDICEVHIDQARSRNQFCDALHCSLQNLIGRPESVE